MITNNENYHNYITRNPVLRIKSDNAHLRSNHQLRRKAFQFTTDLEDFVDKPGHRLQVELFAASRDGILNNWSFWFDGCDARK